MGQLGDARAVDPLIAALNDENRGVRQYAAECLGNLEDTRAVAPLIAALEDENIWVRNYASRALEIITGKYLGRKSAKWQIWWRENKDHLKINPIKTD